MSPSRRNFIGGAVSALIAGAAGPIWPETSCVRTTDRGSANTRLKPAAFSFEELASNSLNYFERLVDAEGLPYFNVFWTQPVEAAHDWPDFGDVMSRQWQGAVMLRRLTGRQAATENIWRRHITAIAPGFNPPA